MRVRPITHDQHVQLIRTARRQAPATLWIAGARVLDVYLREWREAHIAVAGDRIAYVGDKEPLTDEHTTVIDAAGKYVVPGYIEPHAHPFQWYNPSTLSDYALATGTTTLVSDSLVHRGMLPVEEVEDIMERLSQHPVKLFFWARLDPQSQAREAKRFFTRDALARMIEHPRVIQGGELTDWRGVLTEDEDLLFGLKHVRDLGKRMEGHHPGASPDTLNVAAAAGVTACHESIRADEVIERLRLGFYATLRHSSIRPDLPELVRGLLERGISYHPRLMLTSDGPTPPMMRHGVMNHTLRVAMEAGMEPVDAYTMATLNPAVYYGLDAEIGGIAPGRLADLLLLESPENPTPLAVFADGRKWAEGGRLLEQPRGMEWPAYSFPDRTHPDFGPVDPAWFRVRHEGKRVPLFHMRNAVITTLEEIELPADGEGFVSLQHHPELAWLVLLDPVSRRLTRAVVRGYGREIDAIASTYTVSGHWILLGRDPEAMAAAMERVRVLGGGLVVIDEGRVVYELKLPLGGMMTDAPMDDVIGKGEAFVRYTAAKGHEHIDPIYSLLFFTATHLPFVRLTADGIYDVKEGRILAPSVPIG